MIGRARPQHLIGHPIGRALELIVARTDLMLRRETSFEQALDATIAKRLLQPQLRMG